MITTSQVLAIFGLILEFLSVWYTVRKLFWNWEKRLNDLMKAPTKGKRIAMEKRDGMKILSLLFPGMFFQVVAILITP